MHGVQQLGELIETLPVLAGVLLALHDGFPQLLNVRHPNIIEHRLALQTVLWHCAEQQQDLHAQILVVGNLQPDELAGNLQHLLALVGHVGQLHPLLVDDEVWCKAKHVAVALLVRSPAQTERHEEEPGALQQSHLVVQMQVPET